MLMQALMMVLSQAAARCDPPPPNNPGSAVGARAPALGHVLLEVPLMGSAAAPRPLLDSLDERDLKATLMVSADWAERHSAFLRDASSRGHEVGLWMSLRDDIGLSGAYAQDPSFADWVDAIRLARGRVKRASNQRPKTIGMIALTPLGEMAIDALAFKAVLPHERTIGDIPRRVERTDKAKGRTRVLGQGDYADGCGHVVPHWTPAGLDRATHAAARSEWVRVGMPTMDGAVQAKAVLDQWLDQVVLRESWRVVTAHQMAKLAAKAEGDPPKVAPPVAVARTVTKSQLDRATSALVDGPVLPRRPGGTLNLTEAFYALVVHLATDADPGDVTLDHLGGPSTCPRTELTQPISLTDEDVRTAAAALAPRLQGRVPSILQVGPFTLTASEALVLFSRAYRGEALQVGPIRDPQPQSQGCGWGDSKGL